MALLEFSALAYGYTDEPVIVEAASALHPGNIVGLVGANGCGKTTLLCLLLGELAPESGRVQRAKAATVAYVSQTAGGADDDVLFDFVKAGRADLARLAAETEDLQHRLAAKPDDEALLERLGAVQSRFAALGGHRWEHEVERLLLGLSFERGEFRKRLGVLSGGQRQKACLAQALISGANCLVLDEPTNHLDLRAQQFFVDHVQALPRDRAMILVSHDRWLLDALCTHLWELDDGVLYRYPGNYSKYVPLREERRKQAKLAYERQQEHIARTEEYIRRHIAGQNTRQARGRRKLLGRMERLERPAADPELSFVLKPALRSGEQLLLVENLGFTYGGNGEEGRRSAAEDGGAAPAPVEAVREQLATHVAAGPRSLDLNPPLTVAHAKAGGDLVIDGVGFQLFRGERLGIIGPNGCGKTTLLKLLAKQLPPLRGMVAWGANAELGIFHQDSADLGGGHDLLAELRTVEPTIADSAARDYLARFGFSGDDVFSLVETLSGGERSRLTLAKIFRRRPNVLVLDEPTNHLDIYAREALEQFLGAYGGSVIMVTHDRALLERLCDRLLVFPYGSEGERTLTFFRGSYADYLTWQARREVSLGAAEAGRIKAVSGSQGSPTPGPLNVSGSETRCYQESPGQSPAAPDPSRPEVLSIYDVELLAREAHMGAAAFLAKQCARAQAKADEIEGLIAALEERVGELTAEQREADSRQEYVRLGPLQDQIDKLRAEIETHFEALAATQSAAEAWQCLGDSYNPS